METRASQPWAKDQNWEVQTGYQEMILHLQSSEVLEMVIEGPNLCSLVISPALEVFETHSRKSWPDTLWTGGLPAAPSKGHFHLLWHGLGGACKGFCPNCNLLIPSSLFPLLQISQICRNFIVTELCTSLSNCIKIGEQIQKTLGETEGEKKVRNANTLSLFFHTGMITHLVYVLLTQNGSRGQCLW